MTVPLKFGIPTLDGLIDPHDEAMRGAVAQSPMPTVPPRNSPRVADDSSCDSSFAPESVDETTTAITSSVARWTAAIVGPDGCGKSILSLHLASNYWLTNCSEYYDDPAKESSKSKMPRVIYVSTDLSHDQANTQWSNFGLNWPRHRVEAIHSAYQRKDPLPQEENHALKLIKLTPSPDGSAGDVDELPNLLANPSRGIYFVDLQSQTAGDDWGFVNRLVGLMPAGIRHLIIIDAVEGLETYVGQRDAFGQDRDRRSRVAQLVRNAANKGAHLLFVVEEPSADARLPEQFVTDVVIRLRHRVAHTYSQRTIEIEKCRAVAHVRGEHDFAIRTGRGSFTGSQPHLDDPRILWKCEVSHSTPPRLASIEEAIKVSAPASGDSQSLCLAHIHVVHSLHRRNRGVREEQASIAELRGAATFAVDELDHALKESAKWKSKQQSDDGTDQCEGAFTLLLGDSGTRKGRLARGFLAEAFRHPFSNVGDSWNRGEVNVDRGVAILITTRFLDGAILRHRLARHLDIPSSQIDQTRVMCQRLSVRDLSSSAFLELLASYVRAAQVKVLGLPESMSIELRRLRSASIRIVVEEWNEILAMYPSLREDPVLLQSMALLFKREGINALVVSTEPGVPGVAPGHSRDLLRDSDEAKIFTWSVSFFGERRVAITIPPAVDGAGDPAIFELLSEKDDDELLKVDSHFGLYADIDFGRPRRIPLKVHLFSGCHDPTDDNPEWRSFADLASAVLSRAFEKASDSDVLVWHSNPGYGALRLLAGARNDTRLEVASVLQIDEFWRPQASALEDLRPYLNSFQWTTDSVGKVKRVAGADAYRVYEPLSEYGALGNKSVPKTPIDCPKQCITAWKVKDLFIASAISGEAKVNDINDSRVDRVPYLWDFGLLVADKTLWQRHRRLSIPGPGAATWTPGDTSWNVGMIWNVLARGIDEIEPLDPDEKENGKDESENRYAPPEASTVSWRLFLDTCRLLAQKENVAAFDVDLSTPESLSCLLLEIWASEQRDMLYATRNGKDESEGWPFTQGQESLRDLLVRCRYSLFVALRMLITTSPHLRARRRRVYREHASPHFVASREWYHTASSRQRHSAGGELCVLSLPGYFSVRGDWGLAVPVGTRSFKLSTQAIELLSSRRMNLLRLQDGLGLPVRDILPHSLIGRLPTALTRLDQSSCRIVPLSYEEVCTRGAEGADAEDFQWLRRFQIPHYDRDAFYFCRWIARMIEERHEWACIERDDKAVDELFAMLKRNSLARLTSADEVNADLEKISTSLREFDARVDVLRSALRSRPQGAQ